MKQVDDIIKSINGQQPEIQHPDAFTDWIMDSLPEREEEKVVEMRVKAKDTSDGKRDRLMVAIRTVASIAAVWLIGLFVYDYVMTTAEKTGADDSYAYRMINASHGSTPWDVYTYHLGRQKQNHISYSQLKSMINENH